MFNSFGTASGSEQVAIKTRQAKYASRNKPCFEDTSVWFQLKKKVQIVFLFVIVVVSNDNLNVWRLLLAQAKNIIWTLNGNTTFVIHQQPTKPSFVNEGYPPIFFQFSIFFFTFSFQIYSSIREFYHYRCCCC